MQKERYYYLVKLQFLGFRFSGWQKQPNQKTIEQMLHKTLKYIWYNKPFKILGAGRTDAKVSALDAGFELFTNEYIHDLESFIVKFNTNLPPDIRILSIKQVDASFNIIKHSKYKEYVYLFSCGQKNHPFAAPFIANIIEELDIELMKKAAQLFQGEHDFSAYTSRLQENTIAVREIEKCILVENDILHANFFPKNSFALHVKGKGFMRYQIRMIIGALIQLGRGELLFSDIKKSLQKNTTIQLSYVAPGSGLHLNKLEFE